MPLFPVTLPPTAPVTAPAQAAFLTTELPALRALSASEAPVRPAFHAPNRAHAQPLQTALLAELYARTEPPAARPWPMALAQRFWSWC
jgi:hypothetical protein